MSRATTFTLRTVCDWRTMRCACCNRRAGERKTVRALSLCLLLAVYARSGHGHLSFLPRCRRARAVCAGDLAAPGAKFLRAEPAAFAAFALVLTRSVVAASARGGHHNVCAQPAAHQISGKSFSARINAYALCAHALVILGFGAKPTVRVCLF